MPACIPVHEVPDPEHPTPRRWKRLHPPVSSGAFLRRVSLVSPAEGVGALAQPISVSCKRARA